MQHKPAAGRPSTQARPDLLARVRDELTTLTRRGTARARGTNPTLSLVDQSLLTYIETNPQCRAIDIAEHFHLNRSTVSRQLRALADAQLISMTPDAGSTRGQPIALTEKGARVQSDSADAVLRALTERLGAWSDADVEAFARILRRYNDDPQP